MKILVIGSGGREHALVWKISQSKLVNQIFCAPGNAGIAQLATCVNIAVDNIEALLKFVKDNKIDLTVVGPELPLVKGIVDEFQKEGLAIFGPNAFSARLEASKVFAKEMMLKLNVPTAECRIFDDAKEAREYITKSKLPVVVKADGLAQGKGVIVAKTQQEALDAVSSIMETKIFGASGDKVVIEECLEGEEVSVLVLCDGKHCLPLASSQDHKRVFDHDAGPNTGGMGAYSPAPVFTDDMMKDIMKRVVKPIIRKMAKLGFPYKGVLYAGLMLTKDGPKVLEFNVRFGDPETQAILPRLKSDLVKAMLAVVEGTLNRTRLTWRQESCVSVVLTSGGYPGNYEKEKEITGLDVAKGTHDVVVFHAGTKKRDNAIVTDGGRVLGVTGLGATIQAAINTTYQAVRKINFEGVHYRKDIARRALQRTGTV